MIPAYPLTWPDIIPRTPALRRESGAFKVSLSQALRNVEGALALFGKNSGKPVRDVVLSSNCSLGVERPADPGVAAWFTWDGEQVCIPVDRYTTPAANLQAIYHVIEARRVEIRHGTLALVKASFRGFRALPAPPDAKTWRTVLGFRADGFVSREDINAAYRRLAGQCHPDRGGTDQQMAQVNAARDAALREIGGNP